MKDKKSNDCETKDGNKSFDMRIPTNKLFEKSGEGNNKNPPINPIKIAVIRLNFKTSPNTKLAKIVTNMGAVKLMAVA